MLKYNILLDLFEVVMQQKRNIESVSAGVFNSEVNAESLIENDETNEAVNNIVEYIWGSAIREHINISEHDGIYGGIVNFDYDSIYEIKMKILKSMYDEVVPVGMMLINDDCNYDYFVECVTTWQSKEIDKLKKWMTY